MPFGKYKGRRLLDLPEPYLAWFHREGFPDSKLSRQLALMYEVKLKEPLNDSARARRGFAGMTRCGFGERGLVIQRLLGLEGMLRRALK